MAYEVEICDLALNDIEGYVCFIRDAQQEPKAAEQWFRGVVEAIYSLEHHPQPGPSIPEGDELAGEIRHLTYMWHQIIFRAEPKSQRVQIYRVYFGLMPDLRPDALV